MPQDFFYPVDPVAQSVRMDKQRFGGLVQAAGIPQIDVERGQEIGVVLGPFAQQPAQRLAGEFDEVLATIDLGQEPVHSQFATGHDASHSTQLNGRS